MRAMIKNRGLRATDESDLWRALLIAGAVASALAAFALITAACAAPAASPPPPTPDELKTAIDKWSALTKAAEDFHMAAWPIAAYALTHLVAIVPGLAKIPGLGPVLNLVAANYGFAANRDS